MDNLPSSHSIESSYNVEEKQEIAKLKCRLKEQANLITLLMEREERETDHTRQKVADHDTLRTEVESLRTELEKEHERAEALNRRFDELSDKFNEMTQIKYSYKEQVRGLEATLHQLTEKQQLALMPLFEAKEEQIRSLKSQIETLENENKQQQRSSSLQEYTHEQQIQEAEIRQEDLIQRLEKKTADCEDHQHMRQELEEYVLQVRNEVYALQSDKEGTANKSADLREMLMVRGDLMARKDRTIAELTSEINEWRQRLAEAFEKYHEKTSKMDVDERVRSLELDVSRLHQQVKRMENQSAAFQRTSASQLQFEKQNSSLLRSARSISDLIKIQNTIT